MKHKIVLVEPKSQIPYVMTDKETGTTMLNWLKVQMVDTDNEKDLKDLTGTIMRTDFGEPMVLVIQLSKINEIDFKNFTSLLDISVKYSSQRGYQDMLREFEEYYEE